MSSFDLSRVHWEHGKFSPWHVDHQPNTLKNVRLEDSEELVIVNLGGHEYGFLKRELVYHHIIQGKLDGTDFLMTFCGVCNAGALFDPRIDGVVHRFREIGVYNGLQIFQDDETKSLWNHLTGECLHGALEGKRLPLFGSPGMSTYGLALKSDPDFPLFISGKAKVFRAIMNFVIKVILGENNKNWLPPHFEKTLPKLDDRLPKMTMGLALKTGDTASIRFFPVALLKGKSFLTVDGAEYDVSFIEGVPTIQSKDGSMPFQLFTRWYAFSLTYPKGTLITEI